MTESTYIPSEGHTMEIMPIKTKRDYLRTLKEIEG